MHRNSIKIALFATLALGTGCGSRLAKDPEPTNLGSSPKPEVRAVFGLDFGTLVSNTIGPKVRVVDLVSGTTLFDFLAYPSSNRTGVTVATCDVNADGTADIIVGPGPGATADTTVYPVRIIDGKDGKTEIRHFSPFGPAYNGMVHLACGDIDGDGYADVVASKTAGFAADIKVFSGATGNVLWEIQPVPVANYTGGAAIAVGDVNGDGFDDVIAAYGPAGGGLVRVYNGLNGNQLYSRQYFPSTTYLGYFFVAAADVDGDGKAEIILSANIAVPTTPEYANPPQNILVAKADTGAQVWSFNPYDASYTGGFNVAATDIDGDGKAEILVATGEYKSEVKVFNPVTKAQISDSTGLYLPFTGYNGGVNVSAFNR